jgi:hypothetical protein
MFSILRASAAKDSLRKKEVARRVFFSSSTLALIADVSSNTHLFTSDAASIAHHLGGLEFVCFILISVQSRNKVNQDLENLIRLITSKVFLSSGLSFVGQDSDGRW